MSAAEATPDDAESDTIFAQLQDVLMGHKVQLALACLAECVGLTLAQGASDRGEADRVLVSLQNDIRTAFDLYWADPEFRSTAQTTPPGTA